MTDTAARSSCPLSISIIPLGLEASVAFGKASLSGVEKAGLSGFDDAASRAYLAERGFVGQAPKGRWTGTGRTAPTFEEVRSGPRPLYDTLAADHIQPRHHNFFRYPTKSKFLPEEGGQKFATEVYERAGRTAIVDPQTGNFVYVTNMDRTVGFGFWGGRPGLGPWGAQTHGTIVVESSTGRVITQFPGVPEWFLAGI